MPPTAIDVPSSSDRAALTISRPSSVDKSTNCPLTKVSFTFGFDFDLVPFSFIEAGTEYCLLNAHLLYSLILSGVAHDKSSLSICDSCGINDVMSSSIDAVARVS